MTDQPYTEADLRKEAARQHRWLAENHDFMGVSEGMLGRDQWEALTEDDFDTAQRRIDKLLSGAADLSNWAISLGADGLKPSDGAITVDGDGEPLVRIHLAFRPDLNAAAREAFMQGLGGAIADAF